ncbi:MAG: ATP-binding protein [Chloroflexota bacterium]
MRNYIKSLAEIADLSAEAGGERAIIEKLASTAAGLFNTNMASVFLHGSDGTFRHLGGFGVAPSVARKLEAAGTSHWAKELMGNSGHPMLIGNAQKHSPTLEIGAWATLMGATTLMLAPLVSEGKPLGMLVLYYDSPYVYSNEECQVLQTLAALASSVVARAAVAEGDGDVSSKIQLFSVLSHELRTPLTSIMGFTQLIRKRISSSGHADQRLMEQLDVLWAQAQRLNRLIDTFVDLSRIERGEFAITRGKVELTGLLRLAAGQAVAQASSNHTVDLKISSEPLWLHGDNKRLEQVFNNVISNAVRYSPQNETIDVSCREDVFEGNVIIKVEDKGPGIPASRLNEVFEHNYHGGPLRSGGLGVGLYLSKVIVEAHGGHISIESASGVGTTVAIVLPV